jgi:hypothetical protein
MADCINCGEYTKFNGGLCYSCSQKKAISKDIATAEKEPIIKKKKKDKKGYDSPSQDYYLVIDLEKVNDSDFINTNMEIQTTP